MTPPLESEKLIHSRQHLVEAAAGNFETHLEAAEGGCGVVGLAANFPVQGIHLVPAATQMHNRGNGKGGGVAAAGLAPEELGVTAEVLRDATLLQVAYLDPASRETVEAEIIQANYEVLSANRVPTLDDYTQVPGLTVRPPDVHRYFVRARADRLDAFAKTHDLAGLKLRRLEDEFVYQTSFELNNRFYASLGEKQAFVLSHGRDLMVFKIVGYAEQAAAYYKLNNLHAHVWIAHQRYPTKGRVWHPGGAHPFIGLNEALVHNGDFANYHATCTYLRQRNIVPLFLTDTEVSALLFDLWDRVYQYPLEVIIEALAPTTERDFTLLPPEKQTLYRAIQQTHIQASPDGPWFFIIARSQPDAGLNQLLGITDTSMLRPQVFALSETEVDGELRQIGLIASEKQAIDATLTSLHHRDPAIPAVADRYWNARGGSHTDGGAFAFTVHRGNGPSRLATTDKFGREVRVNGDHSEELPASPASAELPAGAAPILALLSAGEVRLAEAWQDLKEVLQGWTIGECQAFLTRLTGSAAQDASRLLPALHLLTRLRDWPYDCGAKRQATLLGLVDESVTLLLDSVPVLNGGPIGALDWVTRGSLKPSHDAEDVLVLNVTDFPPEGDESAGRFIANAAALGWRQILTYGWKGQRFCGCGLGPGSNGVHIEAYGSTGDYLASGLDGAEVVVHGDAQDQIGQILNAGKLVGHQRHLSGLPGRILHGRRSAPWRRLRDPERHRAG